jgi:hypothetical protein
MSKICASRRGAAEELPRLEMSGTDDFLEFLE